MDYNGNDYEGQNLPLAGEESSNKHSSLLLPFALTKFDFDDSLHGHLRFDNLVENEVFLGISSQEDNQWIEDFSRGNSGLDGATKSCALPSHNNVWSEATSSESVEMLLNAVGQEDIIPGENMVEESDRTDTNLIRDDLMDHVDDENPSLPVTEVGEEEIIPGKNMVEESDRTDTNLTRDDITDLVDDENSSLLVTEVEQEEIILAENMVEESDRRDTNLQQNDPTDHADDENPSLPVTEVQGNFSENVGIDNVQAECTIRVLANESCSLIVTSENQEETRILVIESVNDQENLPVPDIDIDNTESPSRVISACVMEDDFVISNCTTKGVSMGVEAEIVDSEIHSPLEIPSKTKSAVEISDINIDETPVLENPLSVPTTDGSDLEKQSDGCNTLIGNSSVSLEGEGYIEAVEIRDTNIDEAPMLENPLSVPTTEGSDFEKQSDGCNMVTYNSSVSLEGEGYIEGLGLKGRDDNELKQAFAPSRAPFKEDNEIQVGPADGLDNSGNYFSTGETRLEKTVQENDLKDDKKLPLDSSNMVCDDNEKEDYSTFPGEGIEVNVEAATTRSQPDTEYPVLSAEVEDTKEDELNDSCEGNLLSCYTGHDDQSKYMAFKATKEPNTLIANDELAPVIETEKGIPLVPEGTKPFMETSSAAMPDEISKESNEKTERIPASDLIVQDDIVKAAATFEKPREAEVEKSVGANSSLVSAASCPIEVDELNQTSVPSISFTKTPPSTVYKQESVKMHEIEKPGEFSINSGVKSLSKDEGSFTFDIARDSSKGSQLFPSIQACELSMTVKGSPSTPISAQTATKTERKTRRASTKSGKESAKKRNQVKETPPPLSQLVAGQLMATVESATKSKVESATKSKGAAVSIPTSSLPDLNTSAALFQQPFTDLQQVQLRAQIFVYGSLIQGAAPDEACMVSAFGMSGSSDGGRSIWEPSWRRTVDRLRGKKSHINNAETPTQSRSGAKTTPSTLQTETLPSSSANRASNKTLSSSPMIPLSSPLWTISTPSRDKPPPGVAMGPLFDYQAVPTLQQHPYQTPPRHNLVANSTTSWPSQSPFPVPWLATSHSSPFNNTITEPVKLTPVKDTKLLSPVPGIHAPGSQTIFPGISPSPLADLKKGTISTAQTSANAKSRRKKSNPLSKKAPPVVEDLTQIPLLHSISTPVVVSSHYSTSITVTTPTSDPIKTGDSRLDNRAINLEGFSKVEEAKLQAEEASIHAASAVNNCQELWSQLGKYKNSNLTPDSEAKLSSAAVAIAAAASVARAAAAAAKVAASAAARAKQMADEAVATHVPRGGDGNNNNPSTLVISAAREAARKRIEAASAATRHAENLDAIVKAAELAAEAVSHAGKIVAMGDPLPLSELVEAGPDGYWKVTKGGSGRGSKSNDGNKNTGEEHVITGEEEGLVVANREKSLKIHKEKSVVFEPNIESRSNSFVVNTNESTESIKEGSLVEVFKDLDGLKQGWFSGKILSLKGGEALVSYTELQSDEGSEWVPLEAKDGKSPLIRLPHPMSVVQFEGTRKRRRAAVKDYNWAEGDKVDAWVQECWREGIIAEKNGKDVTTLSVHFPAEGETLDVKMWHLRPTMIWSDGQWIEWCRSGQDGTFQGDTPMEKRAKLGPSVTDPKGKGKMSKNIDFSEIVKKDEPRLPLSSTEKSFNIGSTKDDNKPNLVRTMRSGLQKEGSRVVFGVPKPGKKRKFMEVSKHYVSDRSAKPNVPNDSAKLAKFTVPQGPRGWKNSTKVDSKEKQIAENNKPKAPRSGKPPIPRRTVPRKDDSNSSRHNATDSKDSISNDDSESEQNATSNLSGGTMVFSSKAIPPENRKKTPSLNTTRSERLNRGKNVPAQKIEKNENLVSDVTEPRRSNRRIQPTSRLLEGLQSSLTVPPKIGSSSHDKSHKSRTTKGSTSRGN